MGVAPVVKRVQTRPITIPKVSNSEQEPEKQSQTGKTFTTTNEDVEGIRKAAQVQGGMPKTNAAGVIMQKAMESGGKEAKIDENKKHGTGKGSVFGQLGYGPYGAGQSLYVWRDKDDNGKNKYGFPQTTPGIALPQLAAGGKYFNVTAPNGRTLRLPVVDRGPRNAIFQAETGIRATVDKDIDINAPAAEAFGYSPKNFPTGGTFKWQLAEDQTSPAGFEYVQRSQKVDTAARAYQASSGGTRPPTAVAAATSLYSPQVASAWGSAMKGNKMGRTVNWLIKNSQGSDAAAWKEFASRFKGTLQDPSYTLQELMALWINSYGAPWKSLANSAIDLLPHNKNMDINKLLQSGEFGGLKDIVSQILNQSMGGSNDGGGAPQNSGPINEPPVVNVPVSNTIHTSNTFTYDPNDGEDSTLTIKAMKALYGMDTDDETWDRNTFDAYSEMVDINDVVKGKVFADDFDDPEEI